MNKLMLQFDSCYGKDYLKTIYSCSCSHKQEIECKHCFHGKECCLKKKERGFVNLNNFVYDFDMISAAINSDENVHSVDSLIVHSETSASLIEFTDGEPRNKNNLVKKSIDTIMTLKKLDNDFNPNKIDFYFVYNSQKFHKDRFDVYKHNNLDSIIDDLFMGFIDLNAEDSILIRYFKLDRVRDYFKCVFAYNEKKFVSAVKQNINKWNVYMSVGL